LFDVRHSPPISPKIAHKIRSFVLLPAQDAKEHEFCELLHRGVAPIMIDHKLLGQVPEPKEEHLYVLIVLQMGDVGIRLRKVSLVVFWYQLEIEIFCELEQLSVFV
jgi:hypothetical protein